MIIMENKRPIGILIFIIVMVLIAVGLTIANHDVDILDSDNTGKRDRSMCQHLDQKLDACVICNLFKIGGLPPHEVENTLEQCVEIPLRPDMRDMTWSKHWRHHSNMTSMRMSNWNLNSTGGRVAIYKDPVKPFESVILEELILFVKAMTRAVAYPVILFLLYCKKQSQSKALKHVKDEKHGMSIKMCVSVPRERLPLKDRKNDMKFEHMLYGHSKGSVKEMKYGNSRDIDWLFQMFEYSWHHVREYIVNSVFQRLATYRPLCDSELSMSPIQFANAGFSYLSEKSLYKCEACKKEIRMDDFTSQPTESLYHQPSCQYIQPNCEQISSAEREYEATSNIVETTNTADVSKQVTETRADALTAKYLQTEKVTGNYDNEQMMNGAAAAPPSSQLTNEDVDNYESPTSYWSSFQDNTSSNNEVEDTSSLSEPPQYPVFTVFKQPSYPAYVSYDSRLDSFAEWNYRHIHDPVTLTEAGCFYAGYADCVRCFQCGLGLRSWKPGDDVYREHHKHRPNCSYLQMQLRVKGITNLASREHARENNSETRTPSYSTDGLSAEHQSKLTMLGKESNKTSTQTTRLNGDDLMMERQSTHFVPQPQLQEQVVGYATNTSPSYNEEVIAALKQNNGQDGSCSLPAPAADGNTNIKKLTRTVLERENKILQKQLKCKICEVNPIKELFLPCGELYACTDCSKLLTHCPSCNKKILATVTTYFA